MKAAKIEFDPIQRCFYLSKRQDLIICKETLYESEYRIVYHGPLSSCSKLLNTYIELGFKDESYYSELKAHEKLLNEVGLYWFDDTDSYRRV